MRIYKSFLAALGRQELPFHQELVLKTIANLGEKLLDLLHNPNLTAIRVRQECNRLGSMRAERFAEASERAVYDGKVLIALSRKSDLVPWKEILLRCRVSDSTARNLMNLAIFAQAHPDIFRKFRRLGPTKLYRLARMTPSELRELDLDAMLSVKRGDVPVRHLSDLELASYLRTRFGPRKRSKARIAYDHGRKARRMIENSGSSWSADWEPYADELAISLRLLDGLRREAGS